MDFSKVKDEILAENAKLKEEFLAISNRLKEIVKRLYEERNTLRDDNKLLREQLNQNMVPLQQNPDDSTVATRQTADDIKQIDRKLLDILKKTLHGLRGVRLSDEELMKIASLSRIRSEVELRHEDLDAGKSVF